MTFAAIDYLSISINLLLVVFVIICLLMTLLILMQRPKQEGLGAAFGAGVTDSVFGARTTNVLQRGTVYLGSAFFLLSLALAVLIGHQNQKKSLINKNIPAKVEAKPAEPVAPKSLSEDLPEPTPVPVTPATPEAETPVPVTPPVTPPASGTTPVTPPAPETPPVVPTPEAVPTPAPAPVEPEVSPTKPEGQ